MRFRLTTGMEDSKDDEKGARYQRGREHCSAHNTLADNWLFTLRFSQLPQLPDVLLPHSHAHARTRDSTEEHLNTIPSSSPILQLRVSGQITPAYA